VAEIRDGLLEAIEAHTRRGLAPAAAAGSAIREFGDPTLVANAFAPELAAAGARRTAIKLLVAAPLLAALWLTALLVAGSIPWQTPAVPAWALGRDVFRLAVVSAALAALLAVASTGRLSRWFAPSPRLAPTAAAAAGTLVVAVDLFALAGLTVTATTASISLAWAPAALAATASLTRLMLASRATRRCLAARRALA
jgi:hypothetical protein